MEINPFFIKNMEDLYARYAKDALDDIIQSKDMYLKDPANFSQECEVLKMYNLSQKTTDQTLSKAILMTIYWYIYQNFVYEMPEFTKTTDKGDQRIKWNVLTDHIIRKYMIVCWKRMRYIYHDGLFVYDETRVGQDITIILRENGYSDNKKIKEVITEVEARIQHFTAYPDEEGPFNFCSNKLVPVENGVLLRSKRCLIPNSPVFGFTYRLPVKYNKDAAIGPIEKFIDDVVECDDRKLLVQIPAQALMQNPDYQLSYLLTGDGANAKSTYVRFLTHLLGPKNIVAISLQELMDNRFATAELHGKLMDLYADIPKKGLTETGKFKTLTGGDRLNGEKKYHDQFMFVNKAVFCFSANELPTVDDATFAFWRRWAVIQFPHTFKVSNRFIKDLITPENLSGFLNLVLDDMDRIEKEGAIRSDKVEEIMDTWKMRSNSAYAFIKKRLKKSAHEWIPKNILWAEYNKFCIENDITELSKIKFRMQLDKEFVITETYIVKDRQRENVLKGIAFIDLSASRRCCNKNDVITDIEPLEEKIAVI